VIAARPVDKSKSLRVAIAVSIALHGALLTTAARRHLKSSPTATAPLELSVDGSVASPEPTPPPLPEPQKTPEAMRHAATSPASVSHAVASPALPSNAPTPSPEPAIGGPVDLTGELPMLASTSPSVGGSGSAGIGGGSAGGGIGHLGSAPSNGGSGTSDRSGGVELENPAWSCPWPREADTEQIDEQTVVIRVVVDREGRVLSATVVVDPGHGFAQVAVACALRTRFKPARDAAGQAIRAASPPIIVRFTR
jgi:outer membrane biosynthesis protein TonB